MNTSPFATKLGRNVELVVSGSLTSWLLLGKRAGECLEVERYGGKAAWKAGAKTMIRVLEKELINQRSVDE